MTPVALGLTWHPLDTWIVAVGAMCAVACALLGSFLVLRRMSMMGDAISHAVLPGLALAFLITGSRDSVIMLVGAGFVGILTAVFTQWVHSAGKVDQGASMGVVFTLLFAIGLILIRRAAVAVDLDPGCVLYGAIETIPLDQVQVLGIALPRAALTMGGVLLLDLLVILVLYKELKLSTFDPALATTLGISARFMHYLLMTLVAITTVAAFESVGSILVIAMLIVPAATARLLTDRLAVMLVLSGILGILAAGLGHLSVLVISDVATAFGFATMDTSTAGMMAVVAGLMFGVALLLAPQHGLISRVLRRARLTLQINREDVLGMLYRADELGAVGRDVRAPASIRTAIGAGPLLGRIVLMNLRRNGRIRTHGNLVELTARGRDEARHLIRSHRLWETYLSEHVGRGPDQVHDAAERFEHVTGPTLQSRLAQQLGDPGTDPHGDPIPHDASTQPADKP